MKNHKEYKEKQLKETQVSVDFSDLVKTVKHLIKQEKKDPRPNYRFQKVEYCMTCYFCEINEVDPSRGDEYICHIDRNKSKKVLPNCACDNYKGKEGRRK